VAEWVRTLHDVIDATKNGWPIRYVPDDEEIVPDIEPMAGWSIERDAIARHHPRLRRIAWAFDPGGERHAFGVLHWDDGTDLAVLDQQASSGADVTDALERTLACEIHRPTCLECLGTWTVAAVLSGTPVNPVPNPRKHRYSTECPGCHQQRWVMHTEVLADG